MAKRKFASHDPFEDESGSTESSWLQASNEIYGDLAAADAKAGERIKRVSIFDVYPDLTQPRRTIPSALRSKWDGSPEGVTKLFTLWMNEIENSGTSLQIAAYLEGEEPDEAEVIDSSLTPLVSPLMKIINLAASIRRDGLTNPVTIAPRGKQYQLETGERRWLAYHLLYNWFDGTSGRPDEREDWQNILAREVPQIDVWRQASENNARADLNAVGKTRQWATLMMELHGRDEFQPMEAFPNEREFYAQVVELQVPYGQGELLRNAMGVSGRSAFSRYRSILSLPDEIWYTADDRDLPEELLYDLSRKPRNEALDYFYENVLGRNISKSRPVKRASLKEYAPGTKRHFAQLTSLINKAGPGKKRQNQLARQSLTELREWLDNQETRLKKFGD